MSKQFSQNLDHGPRHIDFTISIHLFDWMHYAKLLLYQIILILFHVLFYQQSSKTENGIIAWIKNHGNMAEKLIFMPFFNDVYGFDFSSFFPNLVI